jgi:hypothetical protein
MSSFGFQVQFLRVTLVINGKLVIKYIKKDLFDKIFLARPHKN